jgi:SAM-dependent MidA family methyltransferase
VSALDLVLHRIRERGPMTIAEFMEIALYHPAHGYYARAAQRSGRAGDFFTSVDVSPVFGELLAVQFEEMWRILGEGPFDLIEAAAGNGRLAGDVLDGAARHFPAFYDRIRLTLVERSAVARAAQRATLGAHAGRLVESRAELPSTIRGVVFANELLDAFPVHVVVMRPDGPREIFVAERNGALVEAEGAPTVASLTELAHLDAPIPIGVRAELSPGARAWIGRAGEAIECGFLLLVDYGHEARELHSATHQSGTLMAYRAHTAGAVRWLDQPGESDLTSHVNLSATRQAAEAAGLRTLGMVDQTYFLIALGLAERLETGDDRRAVSRRLAARTLIMPGGLGSTMKAMVFARGAGAPALRGLAGGRLT